MKTSISLLLLALFTSMSIYAQGVYIKNDSVFIKESSNQVVKALDLSFLDLKVLPLNLSDFSQLEKLDLSYNQL